MTPSQAQSAWLLLPFLLMIGEGLTTLMVYNRPGISPLEVMLVVYYVLKVAWDVLLQAFRVRRTSWTWSYLRDGLISYTYIAGPILLVQSTVASLATPRAAVWRLLMTAALPAALCMYLSFVGNPGVNPDRVFGQRVRLRRNQETKQED